MNQNLSPLIELQKLDFRIMEVKDQRRKIPERLQAIEAPRREAQQLHQQTSASVDVLIKERRSHEQPISVCGDMASDPQLAALLVGLRIRELSVAPSDLPAVKMALTKLGSRDTERIVIRAMGLDTADEVQRLLDDLLPMIDE